MTVEMTALGTYFAEGVELIESDAFSIQEGADLLLHLFDDQKLRGQVLRVEPMRALVAVKERRWWLDRQSTRVVGRWRVHGEEGAAQHSCKDGHDGAAA